MVQFSCGSSHQSVNREAFISQFPSPPQQCNPNLSTYLTSIAYFYFENSSQIFVGKITSVRREPKKQQSSKHQYFGGFLFLSLLQVGVCCCTVKECLVTHTHSIKETHLPETLTYGKVKQHSFPCQKSDQRGVPRKGVNWKWHYAEFKSKCDSCNMKGKPLYNVVPLFLTPSSEWQLFIQKLLYH